MILNHRLHGVHRVAQSAVLCVSRSLSTPCILCNPWSKNIRMIGPQSAQNTQSLMRRCGVNALIKKLNGVMILNHRLYGVHRIARSAGLCVSRSLSTPCIPCNLWLKNIRGIGPQNTQSAQRLMHGAFLDSLVSELNGRLSV